MKFQDKAFLNRIIGAITKPIMTILQVALIALLVPLTVMAEEPPPKDPKIQLPDYYPERFDKVGELRNLSLSDRMLYMNASKFKLKPEVRVYLLDSPMASLAQLKSKMVIGIQFNSAKEITGIWVLPVKMHHPS
ncbi:MAG: hypothetical protein COB51_12350 [Moraxellaceae bacterium]|nr:MAG: hypothetical protein COB51_12350 [Moraxellaceae bacterium]